MISYRDLLDEVNEYSMKVKQYARLQIDHKIWDSIEYNDLDRWLSNFQTSEEKLLSAILLDSLISRSSAQTTSILTNAIERSIPQALYNSPKEIFEGKEFLNILTSKETSKEIRIVPVIRDQDPPTKSGPSIARMYKRQLGLNEKNMIWPWLIQENIEAGIKSFIFIDDVLATGHQVAEFFNFIKILNTVRR